jgi:glycosyltransferase involved in cell wall biosynthesis
MLYPLAGKVIGVSLEVCEELVKDYGVPEARVNTLANPIDTKSIKKLSKESYNDWRDDVLAEEYLVNIASLTDQKNHELLIHIYSRVIIQHPNLKLVLVGAGPKEKSIENLCIDLGTRVSRQNQITKLHAIFWNHITKRKMASSYKDRKVV